MKTEWKEIPGYRGKYSASKCGQVRSNWRLNNNGSILVRSKIMSPFTRPKGYKVVKLMIDGKHKLFGVHRLVLLAFVGPPRPDQEGAHLDGNPSNNHLVNLKWATPTENAGHKSRHGTKIVGEKSWSATMTASDVVRIRRMYARGTKPARIARELGFKYHAVYDAATGRSWPHLPIERKSQ